MGRQVVHPAFLSLFLLFRIVYIPASVLSHTGHGSPWLNAGMGCAVTLGAEWLARRAGHAIGQRERQRAVGAVMLALVVLGFFPEEAPIGMILWTGIGAAWGTATRGLGWRGPSTLTVFGAGAVGAVLAAAGLVGPGSWLAAVALGIGLWVGRKGSGQRSVVGGRGG